MAVRRRDLPDPEEGVGACAARAAAGKELRNMRRCMKRIVALVTGPARPGSELRLLRYKRPFTGGRYAASANSSPDRCSACVVCPRDGIEEYKSSGEEKRIKVRAEGPKRHDDA